jgi:DNA-directed RNA polymerase subunit RPC12/RpoP
MNNGAKIDIQYYNCPRCQMQINLRKAIERAAKDRHGGRIECPYCKKIVATLS